MKKILLSLGTIVAVVSPITAVIACGDDEADEPENVLPTLSVTSTKTSEQIALAISKISGGETSVQIAALLGIVPATSVKADGKSTFNYDSTAGTLTVESKTTSGVDKRIYKVTPLSGTQLYNHEGGTNLPGHNAAKMPKEPTQGEKHVTQVVTDPDEGTIIIGQYELEYHTEGYAVTANYYYTPEFVAKYPGGPKVGDEISNSKRGPFWAEFDIAAKDVDPSVKAKFMGAYFPNGTNTSDGFEADLKFTSVKLDKPTFSLKDYESNLDIGTISEAITYLQEDDWIEHHARMGQTDEEAKEELAKAVAFINTFKA